MTDDLSPEEIEIYLRRTEQQIQRALLDLPEITGRDVESVNVDTRNFANLKTEIFLKGEGR